MDVSTFLDSSKPKKEWQSVLISKCLFGFFNSPRKQIKTIRLELVRVKGTFKSEKNHEISIFVPSTYRSNISLHTALLFEFSRSKINLKVSILVVSLRKNISRFEWLTNQKAKDYFELIFWNLERLLTLFYIVSFT